MEVIPKLKMKGDIEKATQLQAMSESIAGTLYDIQLTGAREDAFRAPMKLYGRLSALASDITGNGVDFKPTDQQREVYAIFNERLDNINKRFINFMEVELKKLNTQLKKSELQNSIGEEDKIITIDLVSEVVTKHALIVSFAVFGNCGVVCATQSYYVNF